MSEINASTLPAKVAKASLDVGGKLSTDKRNLQQNYDYLSADKILAICGQALAQQGVIIFPDITTQELATVDYTDSYGKQKTRYDCRIEFLFHVCDGTGEMVQRWYGMGSDYAAPDKALYKAITSGHKYFLMKLLCVGAGNEDSEHEPEDGKKVQAPVAQKAAPARTEKKILSELGFDEPVPTQKTNPAVTDYTLPEITLADAKLVKTSKGMAYGDMPDAGLKRMSSEIWAKVHANNLTAEIRDEYLIKLSAINTILGDQ